MYETGGEEGSGFHIFNVAEDQYHRAEVLQRTGAIDITCSLEKVVYGAISADSNDYASLIVMQWFFQPKGSRRISEPTIELLFESDTADDDVAVEKISFLGTHYLMPTKQDESFTRGINPTIGIQQFANLGLGGKWEKTTTKTVSDAIRLSGGMLAPNNRLPNRIATWTISENRTQPTGIPCSLKVAILVSSKERKIFRCRLAFTCQTDCKTAAQSFFKKIPKDDPVLFQPDSRDKGTRPNRNVAYSNDELGSINLDELGGVTLKPIVP
ncbi:hypothetical protein TRIATDRAFT_54116 [Trichoderma atroviride IMI 206040]|uniref:Uncharacterized protein n=2 Tax=Hypocrea atroviridis TaxID=63577 RepID=G9NKR0_HYPAI|nr:uncharacterized protein TRIATDRAFT_54116 [Trichoderma atroviride IMI 206040]EHK48482.1 hypothetical protein TRIATDRAFT_54116 [Trichoderma atroviride IMI 206040]